MKTFDMFSSLQKTKNSLVKLYACQTVILLSIFSSNLQ